MQRMAIFLAVVIYSNISWPSQGEYALVGEFPWPRENNLFWTSLSRNGHFLMLEGQAARQVDIIDLRPGKGFRSIKLDLPEDTIKYPGPFVEFHGQDILVRTKGGTKKKIPFTEVEDIFEKRKQKAIFAVVDSIDLHQREKADGRLEDREGRRISFHNPRIEGAENPFNGEVFYVEGSKRVNLTKGNRLASVGSFQWDWSAKRVFVPEMGEIYYTKTGEWVKIHPPIKTGHWNYNPTGIVPGRDLCVWWLSDESSLNEESEVFLTDFQGNIVQRLSEYAELRPLDFCFGEKCMVLVCVVERAIRIKLYALK